MDGVLIQGGVHPRLRDLPRQNLATKTTLLFIEAVSDAAAFCWHDSSFERL
jgi:hypothetical protein